MLGVIERSEDSGQEGFWFGPHFIRLVRGFTTEAGTVEDIGFVATDLAKALDMQDARNATRGLDPDQKGRHKVTTPGGIQSMTVVSESGFYDLVVRSNKAEARPLRNLVTRQILPALRKTGTYSVGPAAPRPQDSVFGFLEGQQASQELIDAGYKVKMFTLILQGLGKTAEQALSIALRAAAKTNSVFADVVETAGGSFALGYELPEITLSAAQLADEQLPDNWDEEFCRTVCRALGKNYQGWQGKQRGYLVNNLAEELGWVEKKYGPKSKKATWQLTPEGQKHGVMKLALIPNANRTSEKMNVHYYKSAVGLIVAKGNQIYRDAASAGDDFAELF
jgi:prophage antirepressor-like protein